MLSAFAPGQLQSVLVRVRNPNLSVVRNVPSAGDHTRARKSCVPPASRVYHLPCQRTGCSNGWPSMAGAGVLESAGSSLPKAVYL